MSIPNYNANIPALKNVDIFAYAMNQFALVTAELINTKALVASKVTKMKMSVIT